MSSDASRVDLTPGAALFGPHLLVGLLARDFTLVEVSYTSASEHVAIRTLLLLQLLLALLLTVLSAYSAERARFYRAQCFDFVAHHWRLVLTLTAESTHLLQMFAFLVNDTR